MRLDLILEPDSPERFRELGLLAESYGFGGLWTANIVSARDPFMNFMPLAAASNDIAMGPVAISPFELHPAKMANQLYTLNELAGGRAQIVVGGGGGAVIAMGLKQGRRVMHTNMVQGVRECVELLRHVHRGEDYAGEVFQLSGHRADWLRQQNEPAIYIGASKPRMLAMAATVGDGVMLSDVTLHRMPEVMSVLENTLRAEGRSVDSFAVSNLFAWHVKDSRAEAVDRPAANCG